MQTIRMTLASDHALIGNLQIDLLFDASFDSGVQAIHGLQALVEMALSVGELDADTRIVLDACDWHGLKMPAVTFVVSPDGIVMIEWAKDSKPMRNAEKTREMIGRILEMRADRLSIQNRTSISDAVTLASGDCPSFISHFLGWTPRESAALWFAIQTMRN